MFCDNTVQQHRKTKINITVAVCCRFVVEKKTHRYSIQFVCKRWLPRSASCVSCTRGK